MEYNENDIVRLSNEYFERTCSTLVYQQNLFRIEKCSDGGNLVKLENVEAPVSRSEVWPVMIDGVEDRDIYYAPAIAASIVPDWKALPSYHDDEDEYYIKQLEGWEDSDGRTFHDVLQEKRIKYVHEIQHELPEIGDDLKIHYTLNVNRKILKTKN